MQIDLQQSRAHARNYSLAEPRLDIPVRLRGIATAVPGRAVTQAEIAAASKGVFDGRLSDIQRLLPVFAHAGIETRHSDTSWAADAIRSALAMAGARKRHAPETADAAE